jgi:hypothetical protein
MAAKRTVTLVFTDLLADDIPDDKLNGTDMAFVVTELFNSAALRDVKVTISDVERNVPSTDGDADSVDEIQAAIFLNLASMAGFNIPEHEHDEQGNCVFPDDVK